MCTVVFLKESDTSLWLDKIKFLNEPKLTELAKHGVNTIHTNRCVTFDITVNSSALLFLNKLFYITQHIMPYRNTSVNQNKLEDQTAHAQML